MSKLTFSPGSGAYTIIPADSPTSAAAAGRQPFLQTPSGRCFPISDDVEAGGSHHAPTSSHAVPPTSSSSRQQPTLSHSSSIDFDPTNPFLSTRLTISNSGRLISLPPTPEATAAGGEDGEAAAATAAEATGGAGGGGATPLAEGATSVAGGLGATNANNLERWRKAAAQVISIQRVAAQVAPGFLPGLDVRRHDYGGYLGALNAPSRITCVDYSSISVQVYPEINNDTLQDFLLAHPKPDWAKVRWINVQGFSWDVIECLARTFELHPLSVEDIVHIPQRIKADYFPEHIYVSLILLATSPTSTSSSSSSTFQDLGSPRHPPTTSTSSSTTAAAAGKPARGFSIRKKAGAPPAAAAGGGGGVGAGDGGLGVGPAVSGVRYSSTGEDLSGLRHPSQPANQLNRFRSSLLQRQASTTTTSFTPPPAAAAAGASGGGGGSASFQLPGELLVEQASLFLLRDGTLLSFFQGEGERVTGPLMDRLKGYRTLLTDSEDASFLLNCLIDGVVDHAMPVVQLYFKRILELEAQVITEPRPKAALTKELHLLCNDLKALRRALLPMQHLVHKLRSSKHSSNNNNNSSSYYSSCQNMYQDSNSSSNSSSMKDFAAAAVAEGKLMPDQQRLQRQQKQQQVACLSPLTLTYLNDVLDHVTTMVEDMETLEDQAKELIDLIFNTISHHNNTSMQVLAVVSTLFLPITFIAGVYGTNFEGWFPEIHWQYGYIYFWGICVTITVVFSTTLRRWGLFGD